MNQTPTTLLFVDDEERVVNLLRLMFRSQYRVLTANTGDEALALLDDNDVDVIVSDQRMPGMTGIELLERVREYSPHTMRLLLTGYADLAAIVGSVNQGEVFRFITKPWDHSEIKSVIAQAARAAQVSRAAEQTKERGPVEAAPAAGPAPPSLEPNPPDWPALLLLDDNPKHRAVVAQLFASNYRVHAAGSIAQALRLIGEVDIGVIVAEARVAGEDTAPLLRVLKQQHPAITTVMLTSSADADLVVRMINEVQIYRFATKPIRAAAFQLAVSAAMKQHRRIRAEPRINLRYQVAPSKQAQDASLVAGVMRSLGGLRSRLSRLMQ